MLRFLAHKNESDLRAAQLHGGRSEANTAKIVATIAGNPTPTGWCSASWPSRVTTPWTCWMSMVSSRPKMPASTPWPTRGSSQRVVLGVFTRNMGAGKRWHNSLIAVRDGLVLSTYHKQLLPTYNVFDEIRHFEPGPRTSAVWREVQVCLRWGSCCAKIPGNDVARIIPSILWPIWLASPKAAANGSRRTYPRREPQDHRSFRAAAPA